MQTPNYNKRACQEGAQSFKNGKKLFDNPYHSDTQSNYRWERGFQIQKNGYNILPILAEIEPEADVKPKKKVASKKIETFKKATVSKTRKTVPKKAE